VVKTTKKQVNITGTGSYLPEKIMTNADLERMVDTSDDWIVSRTGIRERRIAPAGIAASHMGSLAARRALQDAGIKPEELDLLIVATITPDMQFPSTSCLIQEQIGAKRAISFDIGAACSGFIYGLEVARRMLMNGPYKHALIVGSEKISSITDWKDRATCVLFGDGAGAAVLSKGMGTHRILDMYLASDGSAADLLHLPGGGSRVPASVESVNDGLHFLKMQGKEVFKSAVTTMGMAAEEVLKRCGIAKENVTWIIPHQANKRIINAIAKRLKHSEDRVYVNVDRYGNMSAASTAVGLDEMARSGKLKKGDIILVVVFGSGLTWGSCVIKW
jgi:3-oxoacyl-[acyl-carrier-protein] synthase III